MKDLIRYAIVIGGLVYLFGGGEPKPKPDDPTPVVEPYTGALTALHQASRSMDDKDRLNMSQGFAAGSDMLNADARNLVDTTVKANDYLVALLSFDYNGLGKPTAKYPAVADEIEKEALKVIGDEVKSLDPATKTAYIALLAEFAKAIQ